MIYTFLFYHHNSCHHPPAWSLWCSCTYRILGCYHTCEHTSGQENACIHLYLKDKVKIRSRNYNKRHFEIRNHAVCAAETLEHQVRSTYPHKLDWCCWRCSQAHIHSGRSPTGWYNHDLHRPFQDPCIHQCLWRGRQTTENTELGTMRGLVRCFVCRNSEFFSCTNATGAIFVEMVSSTTVDRVPLADVGSNCVDTDLPSVAWACLGNTFIDIWKHRGYSFLICCIQRWHTTERFTKFPKWKGCIQGGACAVY